MRINNDILKRLFRGYISSRIPAERKGCPSLEELNNAFFSSTSKRQKKKIISHIINCFFCTRDFEVMAELQREQSLFVIETDRNLSLVSTPQKSAFFEILSIRFAPIFLGILLTLSSLVYLKQAYRGVIVQRGLFSSLSAIYPLGDSRYYNNLVFLWEGKASYAYYILELFDRDLMPIWTSPKIPFKSVILPSDILATIEHYKPFFWIVSAYNGGVRILQSELVRFRIID